MEKVGRPKGKYKNILIKKGFPTYLPGFFFYHVSLNKQLYFFWPYGHAITFLYIWQG